MMTVTCGLDWNQLSVEVQQDQGIPARSSGHYIIADEVPVCGPISGGHTGTPDKDCWALYRR